MPAAITPNIIPTLRSQNLILIVAQLPSRSSRYTHWVCLQKDIGGEAETFAQSGRILTFGEDLKDFATTAALVDRLDLVISVDTSVAHLAGALGKPVWIMLPFRSDWRWLTDRTDSPWYPSARLFRQPKIGDWSSVTEQVQTELKLWLSQGTR